MKNYILRNVEPDLWARVKARAQAQQLPLRLVILLLLQGYASGEIHLKATRE